MKNHKGAAEGLQGREEEKFHISFKGGVLYNHRYKRSKTREKCDESAVIHGGSHPQDEGRQL